MPDLSTYPARVPRAVAMELLDISDHNTFNNVVAAHDAKRGLDEKDKLVSKLPGERRAKYRTRAIDLLLNPPNKAVSPIPACEPKGRKSL